VIGPLVRSAARVGAVVAAVVLAVGTFCIDALKFHPATDGYDASTYGYVDIGTNGVKIAAIVLEPERGTPPSQALRRCKKAILRCHGNAEDALATVSLLESLTEDGYTVAAVEYPGYGLSDGSPDEKGCCRNAHRLYDWLVETRGFKPEDIIVNGFSIGTGPATELAATRPCGGLILEAPFLSAPRAVTRVRILPIDPFPNLKRIGDVKCPVLVIHGTRDSVVPYSQGQALFALANEPKRFVSVEGGDHNSLYDDMGCEEYVKLVKDFVEGAGLERRPSDVKGKEPRGAKIQL
jgi:pimeloyl-ACP methyl ester carboxylesterase